MPRRAGRADHAKYDLCLDRADVGTRRPGYDNVIRNFVPLLPERHLPEADIQTLLVANPARAFAYEAETARRAALLPPICYQLSARELGAKRRRDVARRRDQAELVHDAKVVADGAMLKDLLTSAMR